MLLSNCTYPPISEQDYENRSNLVFNKFCTPENNKISYEEFRNVCLQVSASFFFDEGKKLDDLFYLAACKYTIAKSGTDRPGHQN